MLTLMANRGFDAASIGAIAKTAGLAPGLVHYHFRNKEEILEAAVTILVASHDSQLAATLEAESEPSAYLDQFVSLHLELREGNPDPKLALWQAVLAEAARRPRVAAILTDGERKWRDRLAARFSRLGHPAAESAAAGLLAIVRGYLALAASSPAVIPPGSAVVIARSLLQALIEEGCDEA